MIITEKPVIHDSLIAETFGASIGVEMKSTRELMNWIIFGDPKQQSFLGRDTKGF